MADGPRKRRRQAPAYRGRIVRAYHEAGHAIVLRVLGCTSIEVLMYGMTKEGNAAVDYTGDPEWLRGATLEQRLDVDAAGHAAEVELFRRGAWKDVGWEYLKSAPIAAQHDYDSARKRANDAGRDAEEEWLKAVDRATAIIVEHWDEVEAAAELAAPRGVLWLTLYTWADKPARWVVQRDLERPSAPAYESAAEISDRVAAYSRVRMKVSVNPAVTDS